MRLTLNGWPPIASHLACVLLGVSSANVAWKDPPRRLEMAPRSVALSLPKLDGLPEPGARVHVIAPRKSGGACRLTSEPFLLLERAPRPVINAPLTQAALVPELARGLSSGKVSLEDVSTAGAIAPCATTGPKVSYGRS